MYRVKLELEWLQTENKSLRELQMYCDSISIHYEEKIAYMQNKEALMKDLNTNSRKVMELQQKNIEILSKKARRGRSNRKLLFITATLAGALTVALILK